MISTNYSVNSIGFRGFLNTRRSLTSAAKEAVKMAEASSNASKSSGCMILKGKSSEVVEKVEKESKKKGLLKTGITGPIY